MAYDKPFWNGVLRADDGSPSFARLGSAFVLFVSMCWLTFVILKTKTIPELSGVRDFDTFLITALYGVAKVANLLPSLVNNNNNNNKTPS